MGNELLADYIQLSRDELADRVRKGVRAKNALLLAHNYQRMEIKALADRVGDSLQLAREAAETKKAMIVFCGVHFMAESAKILNPSKKVILPDKNAGCPMANMIDASQLREFKALHPGAPVVCYVNSSAEVKAESDVCCTSSNAVSVVESMGKGPILFVPDKNLAAYVQKKTGAELIAWQGHCYVHNRMTPADVADARRQHPSARLIVHPECPSAVCDAADEVASTSGMLRFVERSQAAEFIVGTEMGLIDQLQASHPQKKFYPLREDAVCANMKMTNLAKLAWAIENEKWEIDVPEPVRSAALNALQRMVKS